MVAGRTALHRMVLTGLATVLVCACCAVAAERSAREQGRGDVPQGIRLPPVDEATSDGKLAELRTRALRATEQRDFAAMASLAIPGSVLEADLLARGKLQEDATRFWNETRKALTHGGSFVTSPASRAFCAPYAYTMFPAFAAVPQAFFNNVGDRTVPPLAVLEERLSLRSAPREDAQVVEVLSFHLAKAFQDPMVSVNDWLEIGVPGRPRGWVRRTALWWPDGQYVCFLDIAGSWRLAQFGTDQ